ncbi:MAG: prepilin-type N-terminal cleavage/methylation domain-containing protein [bacterium]|nr:prepilin-type N-terminal cleavage/methylation domain-containing protein [bacterium]
MTEWPKREDYPNLNDRGFTLVELMISMSIFLLALITVFEVITSQKKTFKEEQEVIWSTQNARASQDILLRELRSSGYKVLEPEFLNYLSTWVPADYLPTYPKAVDLSSASCPLITQGNGSDPDMITLLMADVKENALAAAANIGSTQITLDPNSPGFGSGTKFRPNDIIRLGDHTEFARIVSVSGHTLTIDTNPAVAGNQGLAKNYPAGSPVREINIITYAVINEKNDPAHLHHTAGHPVLKRKHNESDYLDVAEDVEDLQIIPATFPNYKLYLITRTSSPGDYTIRSADNYKRTELVADFRLRNFRQTICPKPDSPTLGPLSGLDSSSPCTIHLSWSAVSRDSQGRSLSSECAVSEYIIAYDSSPQTRRYSAHPGNRTSFDLDISAIKDPNHQTYYVSVAAVNSGGVGNYSTERSITDSHPPAAVRNLAASAQERMITLSWTDNPACDVCAFRLYRSRSSGGPYTLIFTDPNVEREVTKTYTYQDTNLPCGTYYYLVRAFDGRYESADSPTASATATDSDPPSGPSAFSFSISGNRVNFTWALSVDDPASGQGDNDVCEYLIYGLNGGNETLIRDSIPAGQTASSITTNTYSDFGIKAKDCCGLTSSLIRQSNPCQPPSTITISRPADGSTVFGYALIEGGANSPRTPLRVELKIDNGPWIQLEGTNSWSYQWDTTTTNNGTHNIYVQAVDNAACSASASVSLVVQNYHQGRDITPPTISNVSFSRSGGGWLTVQVQATIVDSSGIASAGFTYSCGTSPQGPVQMEHTGGDIYRGSYVRHKNDICTITISATDSAGNTATYTNTDSGH